MLECSEKIDALRSLGVASTAVGPGKLMPSVTRERRARISFKAHRFRLNARSNKLHPSQMQLNKIFRSGWRVRIQAQMATIPSSTEMRGPRTCIGRKGTLSLQRIRERMLVAKPLSIFACQTISTRREITRSSSGKGNQNRI